MVEVSTLHEQAGVVHHFFLILILDCMLVYQLLRDDVTVFVSFHLRPVLSQQVLPAFETVAHLASQVTNPL